MSNYRIYRLGQGISIPSTRCTSQKRQLRSTSSTTEPSLRETVCFTCQQVVLSPGRPRRLYTGVQDSPLHLTLGVLEKHVI